MSFTFVLGDNFKQPPEMLVEAQKSVPVDEQNFIPLTILGRSFRKAYPTLVRCGTQAVRMSLYEPFGFMSSGGTEYQRTQRTDDLVIEDGGDGLWVATVETPLAPTGLDKGLFKWGMSFYAAEAEAHIAKRTPGSMD